MARDENELPADDLDDGPKRRSVWRRYWRWVAAVLGGVAILAAACVWLTRERIADRLISSELETLGLPAQYEIESIGPRAQVLRNIVIGDPDMPDLTIDRLEANLVSGQYRLVRPRLFGSYRNGKLSFGSLDPLIFTDSAEPFRLPEMDLILVDGRGLVESDFGPIGVKMAGAGPLRRAFSGMIAVAAPRLELNGCSVADASFYAEVTVNGETPHIAGPMRLGSLACPERGIRLARSALELDATMNRALDGGEGRMKLSIGAAGLGGGRMASAGGTSRFTYRKRALTAHFTLNGKSIASRQIAARSLGIDGVLRTAEGFARIEVDGDVTGSELRLGKGLKSAMAKAGRSSEGTLAGPVIEQLRSAVLREERGSRLAVNFIVRRTGGKTSLVVPQAALRGGSGQALLSLSRVQVIMPGASPAGIAGNFATGGEGLPIIAGRMQRSPAGTLRMDVRMPEYRAGASRLALPELTLVQSGNGALDFSGEARFSGALPGGQAEGVILPLDGDWSLKTGLSMWRDCVEVRFDRLALANLTIERRALPLCPPRGGAIVRSDARTTRIAAGVPRLDLAGRLGETPIRIASGPIGVAWPGKLTARSLDVGLGPADTESRFRITQLEARLSSEVAGTFSDADIRLSAVPLDLAGVRGDWRFAGGALTISGASLNVADRQADARFQPLVARDATLRLADNRITAEARLREPKSDREVVRAEIRHDLASGRGDANLFVDGLLFDDALQPDTVSRLALGVIANTKGAVRGRGRIEWTEAAVTSRGSFSTDSLDFAAAFGPVQGLSGAIVFTDLLGMVTAPDQKLRIASINPGIEVNDGTLSFELRPDLRLAVNGASWPFLGGQLRLQPTLMAIGTTEDFRYTLSIDGLDAARLVEKMDLGNISASGTFDGVLPLVFDKDGGHIVDGLLQSRLPGGNLSYVGKLTYEDLSPMANFAFDALKSLDYRKMRVEMAGSLEGEIVTRVSFDGIRQGKIATRNFLTRQVAKLPIHFNVNFRAPFFQLVSSLRSLYDPAFVRDPRSLGLIDEKGRPVRRQPATPAPSGAKSDGIQPPESEPLP